MTRDELLAAANDYIKEHAHGCVFFVVTDADTVKSAVHGKCSRLAEALTQLGLKSDHIGIAVETAAMLLAKHRVDVMDAMPKTLP